MMYVVQPTSKIVQDFANKHVVLLEQWGIGFLLPSDDGRSVVLNLDVGGVAVASFKVDPEIEEGSLLSILRAVNAMWRNGIEVGKNEKVDELRRFLHLPTTDRQGEMVAQSMRF